MATRRWGRVRSTPSLLDSRSACHAGLCPRWAADGLASPRAGHWFWPILAYASPICWNAFALSCFWPTGRAQAHSPHSRAWRRVSDTLPSISVGFSNGRSLCVEWVLWLGAPPAAKVGRRTRTAPKQRGPSVARQKVVRFPVVLTYHVFEKLRSVDMTLAELELLLGDGEVIEEDHRTDTELEELVLISEWSRARSLRPAGGRRHPRRCGPLPAPGTPPSGDRRGRPSPRAPRWRSPATST